MRSLLIAVLLSVSFNTYAYDVQSSTNQSQLLQVLVALNARIERLERDVTILADTAKTYKTAIETLQRIVKRLNNTSLQNQYNIQALNLAVRNLRDSDVEAPAEWLKLLELNPTEL